MADESIEDKLGGELKDRSRFQRVLEDCVRTARIDRSSHVLVVGGSLRDANVLRNIGFRRVTLTNIDNLSTYTPLRMPGADLDIVYADVEDMAIPDGSYDLVLTHAVLHHCRSPHKALLEMLRVSRHHVILLEPNESLLMRTLIKLRFSFPFELPAVIANNFVAGGVRNTCVPNYIYRWNPRDLYQATASYMPEHDFNLYIRQYWDFNVDEEELARRSETRIGSITKIVGPGAFLAALRAFQGVVNSLPWLGRQGNKFFGCISKHDELKPWLVRKGTQIAFNCNYSQH